MLKAQSGARYAARIAFCALAALVAPWSLVHAGRTIEERRAADPQGEVEIVNLSGMVEVLGWDRNEVEVGGTAGDNVERVDVSSAGNRTSIHVVSRSARSWGTDGEAHLVVHVPAKSAVMAALVSANLKVTGLLGNLKLQTVSGRVSGEVSGDVCATTVSGDVQLTARAAKAIEVKTISGGIRLTGGGGAVDITSVSGSATIELSDVTRGRFKSISGDLTAALTLMPEGQIDSESVSGKVSLKFASTPNAEFDVQSFSGDIRNCFGPKPMESRYGPGSRLQFKNGEGHGHVRVNTKSGEVELCTKGMNGGRVSSLSFTQVARLPRVLPYVY
jgi:Putative adhesin